MGYLARLARSRADSAQDKVNSLTVRQDEITKDLANAKLELRYWIACQEGKPTRRMDKDVQEWAVAMGYCSPEEMQPVQRRPAAATATRSAAPPACSSALKRTRTESFRIDAVDAKADE